jgi:hypothetical protein
MWNDVVRDTEIPADLETSLLHFKTDSALGSGDWTVIWYRDVDRRVAGGIGIWFSSTVRYDLQHCQRYYTNLPVHPPDEQVKHWVIEKRGLRTIVHCTGKQVLDITASTKTCDNPKYTDTWATYWERGVSSIYFPSQHDTASDSYYIG